MSGTVHPLSFYHKSHTTLRSTYPYEEKLWPGQQAGVRAGGQCYYRV